MYHRILELYSGIGGMACAWNESGLQGEIAAAADINTVANEVYRYNFPGTNIINRNIQSITPQEIINLKVDTILMSPPCQPFTRNGNYLDETDRRTNSFLYIIGILDQLDCINYILMENVKGFECSKVRNIFIDKLKECDFTYQEFLLNPLTVGVPNSRLRYYCIARRNNSWDFERENEIMNSLDNNNCKLHSLETIIENEVSDDYLVPDKKLRKANIFDICYKNSTKSSCFTKAYTHYIEGTGSVYTNSTPETVDKCFKAANSYKYGSDEFLTELRELKIRFFTPKEVSLLMSFPKTYRFPISVSRKQCYRLLGNSINVKVVSELLKILFNN